MNLSPSNPYKFLILDRIEQLEISDAFRDVLRILSIMQQDIALVVNANANGTGGLVIVPKYTTAAAPPYEKGGMYFDTTLNKLRIGGATTWETITSV